MQCAVSLYPEFCILRFCSTRPNRIQRIGILGRVERALLESGLTTNDFAGLTITPGTVTPNVNMLDIFKQNERADNPNSILNFGQMSLRKLSMICPEGTKVKINGKEIPLITGIFELGMDQINITSLEFSEAVNVNIYYMF